MQSRPLDFAYVTRIEDTRKLKSVQAQVLVLGARRFEIYIQTAPGIWELLVKIYREELPILLHQRNDKLVQLYTCQLQVQRYHPAIRMVCISCGEDWYCPLVNEIKVERNFL